MSSLTAAESFYFEDILDMSGGYVLDFTDPTYGEFFRSYGIDIHGNQKYRINGKSKAKKMRAFWAQDPDELVARVLGDLLDRYEAICETQGHDRNVNVLKRCRNIVDRLFGQARSTRPVTVDEFLEAQVTMPSLQKLPVESAVTGIIEDRLREAELVSKAGAHLSTIFLCGSVLEAVLLGAANYKPEQFNRSRSSPKNSQGKVKKFPEWTLSELINVASDIGIVEPDVKEFSHGLRSFRNYIHPYEQMSSGFTPDEHTARLCFQVLKLALASVAGER